MATEIITFEIDKEDWDEFNAAFTTLAEYNAEIAVQNDRIIEGNEVEGVDEPLIELKTMKEVEAMNLKTLIDNKITRTRTETAKKLKITSDVTITVTD